MNHLNDEILNKYSDNELSSIEISEINEHIKACPLCLNKLKAHKLADQQLKALEIYHAPVHFTERIMQRIAESTERFKPKKSYFLRFIFSFIVITALAVVIVAFANIPTGSSEEISITEYFVNGISEVFSNYNNIITGKNISIIGAVLSFIFLISVYFIYESHKNFKNNLNKL